MNACLYILRCADASYYIGTTVGDLETRVAEHQAGVSHGLYGPLTPVILVFHYHFDRLEDAAAAEHQVKGGVERKRKR